MSYRRANVDYEGLNQRTGKTEFDGSSGGDGGGGGGTSCNDRNHDARQLPSPTPAADEDL